MTQILRPLSFGELLDGAFTLYRRNFAVFFLVALLPLSPLVLFWILAPALVGGGSSGEMLVQVLPMLLMPYNGIAAVLAIGALTSAAATAYDGGRPSATAALGVGLRRWLVLAAANIVAWVLIGFGMLLFLVPGLILLAMWFGITPAIIVEGRGPFEALSRSRELSRGARTRVLGVMVVAWLITLLPALALSMFAGVSLGMGAWLSSGPSTVDGVTFTAMLQAGSTLLSALTMPFFAAVTLLLYYDRRARTEAPDLESALATLGSEPR